MAASLKYTAEWRGCTRYVSTPRTYACARVGTAGDAEGEEWEEEGRGAPRDMVWRGARGGNAGEGRGRREGR